MGRATLVLVSPAIKAKAHLWIDKAPPGTRVTFQGPQRTLPQNDRMHAMLTDIATQLAWHGVQLSVADWKLLLMDALKREKRLVPNLDNTGFVQLGRSTSDLDVSEMTEMLDLIAAVGAQYGVTFHAKDST